MHCRSSLYLSFLTPSFYRSTGSVARLPGLVSKHSIREIHHLRKQRINILQENRSRLYGERTSQVSEMESASA